MCQLKSSLLVLLIMYEIEAPSCKIILVLTLGAKSVTQPKSDKAEHSQQLVDFPDWR